MSDTVGEEEEEEVLISDCSWLHSPLDHAE